MATGSDTACYGVDTWKGDAHAGYYGDEVLAEFGVDPDRGLIVNGHVPVKIEAGESPLGAAVVAVKLTLHLRSGPQVRPVRHLSVTRSFAVRNAEVA